MAYINAASSADFVRVLVRVTTYSNGAPVAPTAAGFHTTGTASAGTLEVPALQDVTITNTPSTFRWKQLDTASEKVVTSVSSNSISGTLVLDPATFFGTAGGSNAVQKGIFNLSNEKTQVDFLIGLSGLSAGDRTIMGSGFFSGVAPTVSADSPVWTSPVSIEVDGDYTAATI